MIRDEMNELAEMGLDPDAKTITAEALQNAAHLDSFIREVLRTRGSTLNIARTTTCDVLLADYTIPKGKRIRFQFPPSYSAFVSKGPSSFLFQHFLISARHITERMLRNSTGLDG